MMKCTSLCNLRAQRSNACLVVGRTEDSRPCNKGVGPRLGDRPDIIDVDPTINLKAYVKTTFVDEAACLFQFVQRITSIMSTLSITCVR